jgi:hypothetical protein
MSSSGCFEFMLVTPTFSDASVGRLNDVVESSSDPIIAPPASMVAATSHGVAQHFGGDLPNAAV